VAAEIERDNGDNELWIISVTSGTTEIVGSDHSRRVSPRWSTHGDRLAYSSSYQGIVVRDANKREQFLTQPITAAVPTGWTLDEKYVLASWDREGRRERRCGVPISIGRRRCPQEFWPPIPLKISGRGVSHRTANG
jgi:Tol biopolymer transport system component